jgi:hypothetical protein
MSQIGAPENRFVTIATMDGKISRRAAALWLVACACAPPPKPAAKEEPPPEPVDGQKAFFQSYVAARAWSADVQGLRLESVSIPEVKPAGGRFGAWRSTFVSPSKGRVIVYNFSVAQSSGKFIKGVFQDHEEGYSAGLEKPWPVSAFKIGSEQAFQTAIGRRETQEYLKKNPDKPVLLLLEQTKRHPNLAWRVVWGESVSRSDYSVFVDASTGQYLEVMR